MLWPSSTVSYLELRTLSRLAKNLPFEDSGLLGCERDRVALLVFLDVSKALTSFGATNDTNRETDYIPEDLTAQQNHCGNPKFVNFVSLAMLFKRANVWNDDFLRQKTIGVRLEPVERLFYLKMETNRGADRACCWRVGTRYLKFCIKGKCIGWSDMCCELQKVRRVFWAINSSDRPTS